MRLNKYTLKIENKDKCILYNIITKVLIEVDCRCDEIQEQFIDKLTPDEADFYRERLLISEDSNDDIAEMEEIKFNYNYQQEVGRFMIHLGYACNLKCTYCYQSSIKSEHREKKVNIEEIVKFIQQVSDYNRFSIYDICFIGGEPLIYWKEIVEIASRINNLYDSKKIYYSVVTNGTLLDKEHGIEELINNNVLNYQITIDGIKKIHDKYRNNEKNGSFDRIIYNIKNIIQYYPKIILSINCNLSEENYKNVGDMFQFFEKNQINIPVMFSMIFDNGKNVSLECHSNNTIWRDSHLTAIKYGQKYEPFYRDVYLGCALTQNNYYVIGADGNLYKCVNAIDNSDYLISHINDYKSRQYKDRMKKFLSYEPKYSECKQCEIYPICYGGCEYRNKINGFVCEKNLFYENEIPIIKEIVNARSK